MKAEKQLLNWGLLGTARINRGLIPALRKAKRSRLFAVASRDTEKAQAYAAEWKIPQAYGSYDELLADPDVDVVYNSLPNHLHVEWTMKAVEAGKHVLCEKPLALSVEDVEAVQAAAGRAGTIVAEAFMYLHHPQTLAVQELVASGTIGQILYMRGSFAYILTNEPQDIRWKPEMGGGSIWDVGCYPLSFAMRLAGAPIVEVMGMQRLYDTGVDGLFTGQVRFANDIFTQFDSGFIRPFTWGMEIYGSAGKILIPSPFKPEGKVPVQLVKDERVEKIRFPESLLYLGEVEDMEAAVLDGKSQRISLDQTKAHIAALCALIQSAEQGKAVRL